MSYRPDLHELNAFLAIVKHASFRVAADELGMSPSTLSHTMRTLEERLGVRLFNRTTRSVAPTEAGTRLCQKLTPVLSELDLALKDIGDFSSQPSGSLRINASETATRVLMRKIVPTFAERFPEVHLDIVTEGRLVDIVQEGFDAGVRLGEAVPRDMVAIAFGGEGRFVAVASPAYLKRFGTPGTPDALTKHRCIRFRLPSGKIYRWELEKHGQELKVDVTGPLTIDHMGVMVDAAGRGLGIAFVIEQEAAAAIARGELVPVLADWTPPFAGMHLYYPSHRLVPAALRAFIDVLKEVDRGGAAPRARTAAARSPGIPRRKKTAASGKSRG